ncbi:TIGR02391 family protein [Streptomyces sp. NPDC002573]|uniref:TIGR02391 family protein n=1 Tax=Streptomyces sp. NPDC002573 TaxID=3364651 RepID=UPI0036A4EFDE
MLYFDRTIRPFTDVRQLEDYWRIRKQVVGPTRTEADNQPFSDVGDIFGQRRAPVPTPDPQPTLSVTCNLHPLIAKVAAERYNRGAYSDAVRSAVQAVEHRVHTLVAPTSLVGDRLMGMVFNNKPDPPMLTVTRFTDGSLESEQNGMQALFKGAVQALRNPRSHGPDREDDRDEADEMLAFASFLMRRLDIAEVKQRQLAVADAESAT